MSYKLVVTAYQEGILSILFDENQKPIEMQFSRKDHASSAGNIYIGRVKDVVNHMKGAFLDLGNGLKGYYSLEDKAAPFFTKKGSSARIQQGDEFLVQIKKDAVKTKDPAVTSEISISSVYFVAFLNHAGIHYSGKINPVRKKHISEILSSVDLHGFGLIVRTNAEGALESDLLNDLLSLITRLKELKDKAPFKSGATLVYEMPKAYLSMIKNTRRELLCEILVEDPILYKEIEAYLMEYQKDDLSKLRLYQDPLLSLDKLYCVETHVSEAFQERVWLKCGGYLVIQETEALTVVDVNTGKLTTKKSKEEAFLKVNLEAAREIARQLRLRNISGIIIVDFINLIDKEHQQQLLTEFQKELLNDPVKASVIDMTMLGLVEVTRQRTLGTIREQMRDQGEK